MRVSEIRVNQIRVNQGLGVFLTARCQNQFPKVIGHFKSLCVCISVATILAAFAGTTPQTNADNLL